MTELNDGFDQPQDVTDLDLAFGGQANLFPAYNSIPAEFRNMNSRSDWAKFTSDWFFTGFPTDRYLLRKEGVDSEKAYRHLAAILKSWAPKHEHKEAMVAWLMSRWYDGIVDASQVETG